MPFPTFLQRIGLDRAGRDRTTKLIEAITAGRTKEATSILTNLSVSERFNLCSIELSKENENTLGHDVLSFAVQNKQTEVVKALLAGTSKRQRKRLCNSNSAIYMGHAVGNTLFSLSVLSNQPEMTAILTQNFTDQERISLYVSAYYAYRKHASPDFPDNAEPFKLNLKKLIVGMTGDDRVLLCNHYIDDIRHFTFLAHCSFAERSYFAVDPAYYRELTGALITDLTTEQKQRVSSHSCDYSHDHFNLEYCCIHGNITVALTLIESASPDLCQQTLIGLIKKRGYDNSPLTIYIIPEKPQIAMALFKRLNSEQKLAVASLYDSDKKLVFGKVITNKNERLALEIIAGADQKSLSQISNMRLNNKRVNGKYSSMTVLQGAIQEKQTNLALALLKDMPLDERRQRCFANPPQTTELQIALALGDDKVALALIEGFSIEERFLLCTKPISNDYLMDKTHLLACFKDRHVGTSKIANALIEGFSEAQCKQICEMRVYPDEKSGSMFAMFLYQKSEFATHIISRLNKDDRKSLLNTVEEKGYTGEYYAAFACKLGNESGFF